ncbi:ABC transporter permease [Bacillus massiliigorillae]|uniref:ABC transporter permease n=1 Tax=Bacillus massiliigorillae TaxID=1243664 RepID=UPI00039B11B8|nr:ABC transporter permease [Bacillus massiliigorillae]
MLQTFNRRKKTLILIFASSTVLLFIMLGGSFIPESAYDANFSIKNQSPSLSHIFGTDFMGRDMFFRTWKGLTVSLVVGLSAAIISALIALALGITAALSRKADVVISWLIDLLLAVPHIVLLILISIALGKGVVGVVVGVALTHWAALTRIIRAEVLSVRNAPFVQQANKLGMSKWRIAKKHMIPHLFPQFVVGTLLIFPHAILHEASITFLGFGLSPEQPAIGIILSESLKYITSGAWWLAFFPGLMLVCIILLFDALGEQLSALLNPRKSRE